MEEGFQERKQFENCWRAAKPNAFQPSAREIVMAVGEIVLKSIEKRVAKHVMQWQKLTIGILQLYRHPKIS